MFNLPESLTGLTEDELGNLLNDGLDAFRELGITAESPEETIAEGERIAPLIGQIREEQQARVAAAEARAQRVNDLLATVPEQTAENPEEEPAPAAEAVVEQEAPTPTAAEAPVAENVPEPVAASAQSP